MRLGMSPRLAALNAMHRIVSKIPDFRGAIVALNPDGEHGAACHIMANDFPYCYRNETSTGLDEKNTLIEIGFCKKFDNE